MAPARLTWRFVPPAALLGSAAVTSRGENTGDSGLKQSTASHKAPPSFQVSRFFQQGTNGRRSHVCALTSIPEEGESAFLSLLATRCLLSTFLKLVKALVHTIRT